MATGEKRGEEREEWWRRGKMKKSTYALRYSARRWLVNGVSRRFDAPKKGV